MVYFAQSLELAKVDVASVIVQVSLPIAGIEYLYTLVNKVAAAESFYTIVTFIVALDLLLRDSL